MRQKKNDNTPWIVIGIVIGLLLISVALALVNAIQPDPGEEPAGPPVELQPIEPGEGEHPPEEPLMPESEGMQPEPDPQEP